MSRFLGKLDESLPTPHTPQATGFSYVVDKLLVSKLGPSRECCRAVYGFIRVCCCVYCAV